MSKNDAGFSSQNHATCSQRQVELLALGTKHDRKLIPSSRALKCPEETTLKGADRYSGQEGGAISLVTLDKANHKGLASCRWLTSALVPNTQ